MLNAKFNPSTSPGRRNAIRTLRQRSTTLSASIAFPPAKYDKGVCLGGRESIVPYERLSECAARPKTLKRVPAGCSPRQDGAAPKRPAKPRFRRGTGRKRPVLLASERSGGKNAGVRNSPNALFQTNAVLPGSHGTQGALGMSPHAVPNPSFKRSANGRPPSPGRRYTVHFRQPGLGVLPSSPA